MGYADVAPGTTVNSGYREIADGVYAIRECIIKSPLEDPDEEVREWYDPGADLHSSQTAYLVTGEENVLFDTMSPAGDEYILDSLEQILGDEPLDALVVSHPEANHAGNTGTLLRTYPDATLMAPARGVQHEAFGLGDGSTLVEDGDEIDLGGPTVEFVEPLFFDHAMTTWMREKRSDTLFTVDWFGFEHMGRDCLSFNDELTYPLTANQLNRFNGYAFVWHRFVDPDRTDRVIDRLKADPPAIIAAAHGEIVRENVPDYLDVMKDVIRDISEMGTDYHVHTHQMVRSDSDEGVGL